MSTTPVVQPHHLSRKAVIYIRQSTGHQVLTNIESQQLQHAMRDHAHHLGWPDERIEGPRAFWLMSEVPYLARDVVRLAEVVVRRIGVVPIHTGDLGLGFPERRLWWCLTV